jgi:uncharacterized OB-fold protein
MSAKPMPVPDAESRPFWEGCREHRLRIERCADCATARFPPASLCPHCRSGRSEWITASGRGTVFSWIVVRHPVPKDIYAPEVPYVVALVELEEGVRMPTNLVGCAPEAIRAGMPVEVVFEDVSADITLPRFRPRVPL